MKKISGSHSTLNAFFKFANSGYITLLVVFLAIGVISAFPGCGNIAKPGGEMFLTFISISTIPIIFSSVTSCIIRLAAGDNRTVKIKRLILIIFIALLISSIIGALICLLMEPGNDIRNSKIISDLIMKDTQKSIIKISLTESLNSLYKFQFSDFLITLFPRNPFRAFAEGNIIQILSISILIGIAISKLDSRTVNYSIMTLNIIMSCFKSILKFQTKILPLGLFFVLLSNFSRIDLNAFGAMKSFCLSVGICFLCLLSIAFFIFLLYSPIGAKRSLIALQKPITIAFSTCSNQATLPFLATVLNEQFKLPKNAVDISIPLGISVCRVSAVSYYSLVTIFTMSLYNDPVTAFSLCFVIIGAIITSFAASGATGIVAITMISIILNPLNIPIGTAFSLLIIVEPILDPLRTITSLILNAAISCMVINKKRWRTT
ncbi:MAG: dicarboxylate/amino acid:cation symporter [Holosporales bacterium]|nr:dicarboxylate/amino acid:cation symporter [Holosporales bacterium]